jgi:hypothetical protein
VAVAIIQGHLPKPDFAAIADTGYEKEATWEYMEQWLKPGLAEVGVDLVRVGKEFVAPWASGVFATNGDLLIPAFTVQGGKLPNFCTRAWKTDVVDAWLSRVHGVTKSQRRKWIGFSYDEPKRVSRMMAGNDYKEGRVFFPLIDAFPCNREKAKRIVREHGWPEPPRSNCWMCPNQTDEEWRLLSPSERQKAIEFEAEIRQRDPDFFLHKNLVPIGDVDFTGHPETPGMEHKTCASGECFV